MPLTKISLGGREIARMGLGTNRLTETDQHIEFIRAAASSGLGLIDTAHLYQSGSSERTIGAALGGDGPIVVATKGGFGRGEGAPDVLRAQVEESLRRLRTDRIFLYYLHRVDPDTPLETSVAVLAEYRDRGVIQNIGLSQVGIEQIDAARRIAPIAAVQNHYNLEERGWESVVDYCEREGIAFVPFYPLRAGHPELDRIARRHGATSSQIALAWLLHRSPAMLPIPGTLSIDHVRENVAALDIDLSGEDIEALR
jgi:aryl-alcohol dehydrogenase-like predicted oxidoreductase